jgi:hypothetical protein
MAVRKGWLTYWNDAMPFSRYFRVVAASLVLLFSLAGCVVVDRGHGYGPRHERPPGYWRR